MLVLTINVDGVSQQWQLGWGDVIGDVENIIGSDFTDNITAISTGGRIAHGDGNDTLTGSDGAHY